MFEQSIAALQSERIALRDSLRAVEKAIKCLSGGRLRGPGRAERGAEDGKGARKTKGIQEAVYLILKAHPNGITTGDIADKAGVSKNAVGCAFHRLRSSETILSKRKLGQKDLLFYLKEKKAK